MKSWNFAAAASAARAVMRVLLVALQSKSGTRRIALMGLVLAASSLGAGGALAAGEPWDRNPIVVYPGSVSPQTAGAANALVQRAAADGQVRVIVGLRIRMHPESAVSSDVARQEAAALDTLQNAVATRVGTSPAALVKYRFIPYMSMFVDAAQAGRLIADPGVASIQEDIPKPPNLADSIPIINADKMWKINYTGSGWVVAVLDTGADKTHPMLKSKVVSEACYSTTNSKASASSVCPGGKNSTASGSGVNCPVSISGCDHGTHVSSIAVGSSSVLNGVAKGAQLIPIQVFTKFTNKTSCGSLATPCALSYTSDQVSGLQRIYALRKTYKIAAVNMSLGGGKYSGNCNSSDPSVATAISNLRSVSIATVVASGNSGYDGFVADPACVSDAIAVGATTKSDGIASYSNHSALVKLLAPGDSIRAAIPGGKYAVKSGTSMATPHVAGAFALLRPSVPKLVVGDLVNALSCSGKLVARNGLAKPRIDVFDAYRRMRPPSSIADWTFATADDGVDWASLVQSFVVKSGFFKLDPVGPGYAMAGVPNCNASFNVTAKLRRTDPDGYWINGIIIKASVNYNNATISGYVLFFGLDGSAAVYRWDSCNPFTDKCVRSVTLCDFTAGFPVNKTSDNTIQAIANGKYMKFYLNGKLVCAKSDATYNSGEVIAFAYFPNSTTGHTFGIDEVSIKSLETKYPSPANADVMDPAAYAPGPTGATATLRVPASTN